jgi:hypothetical protein
MSSQLPSYVFLVPSWDWRVRRILVTIELSSLQVKNLQGKKLLGNNLPVKALQVRSFTLISARKRT